MMKIFAWSRCRAGVGKRDGEEGRGKEERRGKERGGKGREGSAVL